MNKIEQSRYWKYLVIAVIVIQVGVIIYWGNQKGGYYWDEFFTFDNAHYASSITPDRVKLYDAEFMEYDKWFDLGKLKSTLTVTRENSLFNDSFAYNLNKLMRGKGYNEVALNYVETIFFPGKLTKWSAISLNIILFIINQILLYKIAYRMTEKKNTALFAMMLYGFSGMAISMTVFIRFYMWVTMFFTIFIYFHVLIYQEDNVWKNLCYVMVAGVALLLSFNQQILVIFAGAGFVGCFSVMLLLRKEYKKCAYYIIPIVGGGSVYLVFFTSYLKEIFFSDEVGANINNSATLYYLSKAKDLNFQEFLSRICKLLNTVNRYLFGHSLVFCMFCILILCCIVFGLIKSRNKTEKTTLPALWWVFAGTIVIYGVASLCINISGSTRYNSFVFPLIAICVAAFIFEYGERIVNKKTLTFIVCVLLACQMYYTFTIPRIDSLYREDKTEVDKIHQISGMDSVVVDYHFDDKVMYECLAYGEENSKVMFMKSTMIDFAECKKQFLLWQTVNHGLDIEDSLINAGYTQIEEVAQTHESRIYLCTKTQ